jgi:hypothetical protein
MHRCHCFGPPLAAGPRPPHKHSLHFAVDCILLLAARFPFPRGPPVGRPFVPSVPRCVRSILSAAPHHFLAPSLAKFLPLRLVPLCLPLGVPLGQISPLAPFFILFCMQDLSPISLLRLYPTYMVQAAVAHCVSPSLFSACVGCGSGRTCNSGLSCWLLPGQWILYLPPLCTPLPVPALSLCTLSSPLVLSALSATLSPHAPPCGGRPCFLPAAVVSLFSPPSRCTCSV